MSSLIPEKKAEADVLSFVGGFTLTALTLPEVVTLLAIASVGATVYCVSSSECTNTFKNIGTAGSQNLQDLSSLLSSQGNNISTSFNSLKNSVGFNDFLHNIFTSLGIKSSGMYNKTPSLVEYKNDFLNVETTFTDDILYENISSMNFADNTYQPMFSLLNRYGENSFFKFDKINKILYLYGGSSGNSSFRAINVLTNTVVGYSDSAFRYVKFRAGELPSLSNYLLKLNTVDKTALYGVFAFSKLSTLVTSLANARPEPWENVVPKDFNLDLDNLKKNNPGLTWDPTAGFNMPLDNIKVPSLDLTLSPTGALSIPNTKTQIVTDSSVTVGSSTTTDTGTGTETKPNQDDNTFKKFKGLITTKFPFSLPWDLLEFFKLMSFAPKEFRFEHTFEISGYKIPINFQMPKVFNDFLPFFHWFLKATFIWYLINSTRKILGGAS